MTLPEIRSTLARTPKALSALLADQNEAWVKANEGPETFSPFDVVGHLLAGEHTDWLPRIERILKDGEAKAFDPFDRFEMYETTKGKTMDDLLEGFAAAREENLKKLDALQLKPEHLELHGMHPTLGSVTMGQLLSTWVLHDISHITQITRTMSRQLGPAVGPWTEFFSLFKKPEPQP